MAPGDSSRTSLKLKDHGKANRKGPGIEPHGKWEQREAPDRVEGGFVEDLMRGGAQERDRTDHPVWKDGDFDVHGSGEATPARRQRIPEAFLDQPTEPREVWAMLGSRASPGPGGPQGEPSIPCAALSRTGSSKTFVTGTRIRARPRFDRVALAVVSARRRPTRRWSGPFIVPGWNRRQPAFRRRARRTLLGAERRLRPLLGVDGETGEARRLVGETWRLRGTVRIRGFRGRV